MLSLPRIRSWVSYKNIQKLTTFLTFQSNPKQNLSLTVPVRRILSHTHLQFFSAANMEYYGLEPTITVVASYSVLENIILNF